MIKTRLFRKAMRDHHCAFLKTSEEICDENRLVHPCLKLKRIKAKTRYNCFRAAATSAFSSGRIGAVRALSK